MAFPIFPVLRGRAWSIKRTPHFATRVQRGVSGRELRVADHGSPIWEWEVAHEILLDSHDIRAGAGVGTGFDDLRALMALFTITQGSYAPFVYYDPSDSFVAAAPMGFGNGVAVNFAFLRQLTAGSLYEVMNGVSSFSDSTLNATLGFTVPVPLVYVNGVLKTYSTDYTFYNAIQNADSQWSSGVTFVTPPANGLAVTGTFTYLFICRFSDDNVEFENFSYQRWSQAGIKFRSLL